jgi:hypothetical protein
MDMTQMRRQVYWVSMVTLGLLIASCTPLLQYQVIYSTEEHDSSFSGLRAYLDQANANGQALHVVLLHGMGLGEPDEGESLYDTGFSVSELPTKTLYDQVRVYRYQASLGGKKIVFHEINYAAYLAFPAGQFPYGKSWPVDKRILYNNDKLLTRYAVPYNELIKTKIITWGFADATTYLDSKKREIITTNVAEALKDINEESTNGTVSFITQSLGSKVLFDSLARLYGLGVPKPPGIASDDIDILKNTQSIYMMANQLPLLELGTNVDHPLEGESLYQWERLFQSSKISDTNFSTPKQLTIVAFSDPNDLLTFPIGPTIQQYVGTNTTLRAIDIAIPISTPIAGLFSDPVMAHTWHFHNSSVMGLLINGKGANSGY